MKKATQFFMFISMMSVMANAGTMSWLAGPVPSDTHVIYGTTVVELYRDSGDSIFTWGGEGTALQTASFSDWSDPAGWYAGDSYNYGVNQGVQNFWAVYHDTTGGGYYSVAQGGMHSVPNDLNGSGMDDWAVASPTATWTEIAAVPEPSTVGLLLVGAGLLALRRVRRG